MMIHSLFRRRYHLFEGHGIITVVDEPGCTTVYSRERGFWVRDKTWTGNDASEWEHCTWEDRLYGNSIEDTAVIKRAAEVFQV